MSVRALRMALPLGIAWALGSCEAMLFVAPKATPPQPEPPIIAPARQQGTGKSPVTASTKRRVDTASATQPSQPAKRAEPTTRQRSGAILARLPEPRPPDHEPVATADAPPQEELSRVSYPVSSPMTVRPSEPVASREHVAQQPLDGDHCDCSDLFCAQPLKDCGQLWGPAP